MTRGGVGGVLWVFLAGPVLLGCSAERPRAEPEPACVTWRDDVAAVVAERCVACHGPADPAASYDLSTYEGTLGPGSDVEANAIAGDLTSTLLLVLHPSTAEGAHATAADIYPLMERWVVECRLWYGRSLIHEGGIMNPADPAFHGQLLRAQGWNFALCGECHGEDFAGGTSGASCIDCHTKGPTDCTTCHGDGPESGGHLAHAGRGALGAAYDCAMCHVVPETYTDPGHILGADGSPDEPPAEVVFGELAALDIGVRAGPPEYRPATGTCRNVYCHGDTLSDSNAAVTEPVWTEPGQAGCGACHGLAPASHADDRCGACHGRVAVDQGEQARVIDPGLHIDGAVSLGRGTGDCTDCHATPADLAGRTDTTLVTVGAHQSHVTGAHGLRGPIPCSDCHLEPENVDDPGHIDSPAPAEVFAPGVTGVARAGGAIPTWDRAAATCSDVYCHGGGTDLAGDGAAGLLRAPVWTQVARDQAACGTCHGVPPVDGDHDAAMDLATCHTCHPGTVDSFGNIILRGQVGSETSDHINGTLDL